MDRKDIVLLAEAAAHVNRYDDLIEVITRLLSDYPQDLSCHERDLLATGLKCTMLPLRSSLRLLTTMLAERSDLKDMPDMDVLRARIELDICGVCYDALSLMDAQCIPRCSDSQALVFYLKTKADFLRYRAECQRGVQFIESARAAHEAYSKAFQKAAGCMDSADSLVLGLALNYSVFMFDILHDRNSACVLLKHAYDSAQDSVCCLRGAASDVSAALMALLCDNLHLWSEGRPIDWMDRRRIAYTFDDYISWNQHLVQIEKEQTIDSMEARKLVSPKANVEISASNRSDIHNFVAAKTLETKKPMIYISTDSENVIPLPNSKSSQL